MLAEETDVKISRRQFLALTAAGLAGAPPLALAAAPAAGDAADASAALPSAAAAASAAAPASQASAPSLAELADPPVWPGAEWERIDPDKLGWSPDDLDDVHAYAASIGTASLLIVQHGRVVDSFGEIAARREINSVRKSLLSALIGIAVAEGKVDLDATLGSLGIDDRPPALSQAEKQATVRELLQARSGVYHPALYETAAEKRLRPARGSHAPGSFWYYNNWDFNVLGTIYEHAVGASIFDSFAQRIATPIGMQDYRARDGRYVRGADSIHPAYPLHMSARDLARFGLLYLRRGQWRQRAIVPAAWVAESTTGVSPTRGGDAEYAWLWWAGLPDSGAAGLKLPPGAFWAEGHGGQYLIVDPLNDMVVVHQTVAGRTRVSAPAMGRLMGLIHDAAGIGAPMV